MSASAIEWTEHTWNPIVGCSIVSSGCTNCYAMKQAGRLLDRPGSHYDGTTKRVNGNTAWTGKVSLAPLAIVMAPLKRKKPTTYFVNSMGDLFHEDVPDEWLDRIFSVMALCPQHKFQVLTKRAERMRGYIAEIVADQNLGLNRFGITALATGLHGPAGSLPCWPLLNVWLGFSTEDQPRFNERWSYLRDTLAAVRFVSLEPLLGEIDARAALNVIPVFTSTLYAQTGNISRPTMRWEPSYCVDDPTRTPIKSQLDWVIVGGESGPQARPMHPDWARSLREQCRAAGVPFFFKQHGEWREPQGDEAYDTSFGRAGKPPAFIISGDGTVHCYQGPGFYDGRAVIRVGKKAAGRLLDGIEHSVMPVHP